jgi:uncharacterized protein (TIGR00255 family)
MTGFGRGKHTRNGMTASVEVRSVNSRFLEVFSRLPRPFSQRENDVREIVRSMVQRGKINVSVSVETDTNGLAPLKINTSAAKAYHKLLNDLRRTVKLREQVTLAHLLTFSDVLEPPESTQGEEEQWEIVTAAIRSALEEMNAMRRNEGAELAKDLTKRLQWLNATLDRIEALSKDRIPAERQRLQERITQLLGDKMVIEQNRLELEIALLADKLDVTEECVRFRSHNKFFLEAIRHGDAAGRKLNFLAQEMNREANTIGSKSGDAEIAHMVVQMKEELEKMREQLQNIE